MIPEKLVQNILTSWNTVHKISKGKVYWSEYISVIRALTHISEELEGKIKQETEMGDPA